MTTVSYVVFANTKCAVKCEFYTNVAPPLCDAALE